MFVPIESVMTGPARWRRKLAPMTPDEARAARVDGALHPLRVLMSADVGVQWLEVLDGVAWFVVSTRHESRIVQCPVAALAGVRVHEAADELEPVSLTFESQPVTATRDGHNGIAEALALGAMFGVQLRIGYTKERAIVAQSRHLTDLKVPPSGDRIFAADLDRGGNLRSFLLPRVAGVELCPGSREAVRWSEDAGAYQRGAA